MSLRHRIHTKTCRARHAASDRFYEQGRADFARGVAADACPLPARNVVQRRYWLIGWSVAAQEYQRARERERAMLRDNPC